MQPTEMLKTEPSFVIFHWSYLLAKHYWLLLLLHESDETTAVEAQLKDKKFSTESINRKKKKERNIYFELSLRGGLSIFGAFVISNTERRKQIHFWFKF
jgi:hypothetical protein